MDMQIQAHIPDSYIENLSQRLEVYRRIADIRTREDALDVTDELIDRFGEPPETRQGPDRSSAAAQPGLRPGHQRGQAARRLPAAV